MANPAVSVIVPVYLVEPYLRRCADSVLAQTLTDIEVILVDDGSPDNCPAVCDEYARRDSRVRVIHQKNGGLGSARNAGLAEASGEYIAFVDGDDFIDPGMYGHMLSAIRNNQADICICGYQKVQENGKPSGPSESFENRTMTGMQAIEYLYTGHYIYFTIACNKLFKRGLFSEIRFPEGKLFEDGYAAFRYYYASRSVVCLPGLYYFYLTRSNSITTSSLSIKNLDGLDAEVDSVDFLKEKGCLDLLAKAQTKYFAAVIRSLKRFDLNQQDVSLKFKKINKDFRRLYPDIRKNPVLSNKEKFTAALFKISPRLCKLFIRVKKL